MKQGLICNSRLLGHWTEIKENGGLIIRLRDGKDNLKRTIPSETSQIQIW